MKRSAYLGLAFLMGSSTACVDAEAIDPADASDPADAGDLANHENHPFYVATFDHAPDEDEMQLDLAQFLATASARAGIAPIVPVPLPLQPSQKLVRITATTSNITNAGTDGTLQFWGIWQSSGEQHYDLNNPNTDDLNQNTVSVFYYVQNMGADATDQFTSGNIVSFSTDGWHCNNIAIRESNSAGASRDQALPFNVWVDVEPPSFFDISSSLLATNSTWLRY